MLLFGWPFHSSRILLMVISLCSCIHLGSSAPTADIHDEVMEAEQQPWTWNEWNSPASTFGKVVISPSSEEQEDSVSNRQSEENSIEYDTAAARPFLYHSKKRSQQDQKTVGIRRRVPKPEQNEEEYPNGFILPDEDHQTTATSSSADVVLAEPRILPLLGSHAAVAKLTRQRENVLKKILRQAARRQSMKRSPNCMRKCIAQGLLHPAQCHSLC